MRELDLFYDNRKSKVSHYEGRLGVLITTQRSLNYRSFVMNIIFIIVERVNQLIYQKGA